MKRVIHRATQREAAVKIIAKARKDAPQERVLQRIREEVGKAVPSSSGLECCRHLYVRDVQSSEALDVS